MLVISIVFGPIVEDEGGNLGAANLSATQKMFSCVRVAGVDVWHQAHDQRGRGRAVVAQGPQHKHRDWQWRPERLNVDLQSVDWAAHPPRSREGSARLNKVYSGHCKIKKDGKGVLSIRNEEADGAFLGPRPVGGTGRR